ncbi:phosphoesterase-domain-containing protein, partial [Apiospora hydei]
RLPPTSKGKAFDRILQIYLETTAYENATADPNCQALIKQGILLTQEYGVGAPSQPNYIAPASGDDFGLNSDSFILVNKNVSTIVDLLEDKGISWGDYNEGLPYSGFDGFNYSNPTEGYYVRKHNLLMRFNSIADDPDRAAKVKNLTLFYDDLANHRLPQWGFVTPNLYNNGHDTNITVSCNWTRSFVEPLLANPYFNDNTVIYITWQANGQNPVARNHVAEPDRHHRRRLPQPLPELSSVEANWDLHTLGRWDVGANVWKFVADKTGDVIRSWNERIAGDLFENYYWNQSYGGVFSSAVEGLHVYVAPNVGLVHHGRTVLPSIVRTWARFCNRLPDYYRDIIELPDALHPPQGFEVPIGLMPAMPIFTPITEFPVALRSDVNPVTTD